MALTLQQHLYRQRRQNRMRSTGAGFDLPAPCSPLPFVIRAKQAIEEIAAVLTPLVWSAASIEFKPQRVVFKFRERLDSPTMTRARVRLLNLGLLSQVRALQRCPALTPEYGLFRCGRFNVRVEFVTLK